MSHDEMPMKAEEYEKHFGRLLIKNITDPEYNLEAKVHLYFYIPIFCLLGVSCILLPFLSDLSRHPMFIGTPYWVIVPIIGIMCIGVVGQQAYFYLYLPHGVCLYEKGFLWRGRWGRDDEGDFTPFNDVERILVAPTMATAVKLAKGIKTVGFGEPLTDGYDDWEYSKTEVENDAREMVGNIVIVTKHGYFDFETSLMPNRRVKDFQSFRKRLKEIAEANDLRYIDELDISAGQVPEKPVTFKNVKECEQEYGKILYENFTKDESHLFERGVLRWTDWPHEPSECSFLFFKNTERILVQPSKETALKMLEPIERLWDDHAPLDTKELCERNLKNLEGIALGWENDVIFIGRRKRAEWWAIPVRDFRDLRKFLSLARPFAERYGVEIIDESNLPSATGEKVKA